ncbi:Ger(x)C family spore germination protein [Bacillus sp. AFS055030]|uniref:Ger(x)C family spore germination protein n=1 Tax=Bacillus sp. AFS055030 TaxID=2033507 RepID=UPI000BFB6411|nr:Ger(x)C family spore germination protein [Bacillus sp. AFS055030]PGL73225.1 hypothetical protein CN925_00805 [Bacillus sp. AFS055030]
MIRILKLTIILFCFLSLVSGCSDYTELNKKSFVMGLGVDWTKDSNYKITMQIINPKELAGQEGGKGEASPTNIYSSTGKTLSEAARNANKKVTKIMDYSHVTLAVVGEEAAKHGLNEFVDAILREPRISNIMSVIVAKNTTAEKILGTVTPVDQVSSMEMASKMKNNLTSLGESVNPNILQLGENLRSTGSDIAISGVSLIDERQEKGELKNVESIKPTQTLIDEVALFRQGKLVGWLSGKQTRALLMIRKQLEETNLAVPCGHNQYISLRITEQKLKTDVKVNNNKAFIRIDNSFLAVLDETGCSSNLESFKEINNIQKKAGKVVEAQMRDGILTAQNYKSDVFGFGNRLHINNPQQWKKVENKWRDLFAKADIEVKAKVFIRRKGMLASPLFNKE